MRDYVDAFLADLRSRYAECSLIELTLSGRDDIQELIGTFEARRDGITRRHVYRIGKPVNGDDIAARADLGEALEQFRKEIHRITRLPRDHK